MASEHVMDFDTIAHAMRKAGYWQIEVTLGDDGGYEVAARTREGWKAMVSDPEARGRAEGRIEGAKAMHEAIVKACDRIESPFGDYSPEVGAFYHAMEMLEEAIRTLDPTTIGDVK